MNLSLTYPTGKKKTLSGCIYPECKAAPFVEVAELTPWRTMAGVLAGHVLMRSCPQPHQMAGPAWVRTQSQAAPPPPPAPAAAHYQTLLLCGDAGRPGRHMQGAKQEQRNNSGGWWAGLNREAES